jgi:hypothetical protein
MLRQPLKFKKTENPGFFSSCLSYFYLPEIFLLVSAGRMRYFVKASVGSSITYKVSHDPLQRYEERKQDNRIELSQEMMWNCGHCEGT